MAMARDSPTTNDSRSKRKKISTNFRTNRRKFLVGAGAAAAAGLAGCSGGDDDGDGDGDGGGDGDGTPGGTDQGTSIGGPDEFVNLTMMFGWLPKGQLGGFYVAKQQGYWAERNLGVQLNRGFGGTQSVQAMTSGQAEFSNPGFSEIGDIVRQGADLVSVGQMYNKNPTAIISLPDSGITEPQDIVGTVGAFESGGTSETMLRVLCNTEGIAFAEDFEWVQAAGAGPEFLISEDADFVSDWGTNAPQLWYSDNPVEPNFILYANHIPAVGQQIVTKRSFAEENPDVVKAFLDGLYEGWQWIFENGEDGIDQAVEWQLEQFPVMALQEGPPDFHRANLELALTLMLSDEVQSQGLGYQNTERIGAWIEALNENLWEEVNFSPSELMMTDFIEEGEYPIDVDAGRDLVRTVNPGGFENPLM